MRGGEARDQQNRNVLWIFETHYYCENNGREEERYGGTGGVGGGKEETGFEVVGGGEEERHHPNPIRVREGKRKREIESGGEWKRRRKV